MAIKKKEDATPKAEETVSQELHTEEKVDVEIFNEEGEVKKTEESVPLSLVQKMMEEMEEKFKQQVNSLSNKISVEKGKASLQEDLDYVNDLEEDWLEIPVVFFAFSLNFSIHGDKKRGIEELPPFGAIKFNPLIRTKKRGARGAVQVVSVSSVKVQSKTELEYLRGHSQFGIAFYENMESAMNVDATWAQKMVEAQQSISKLSDMQIIARAKQEGISISQSPEAMRRQLVEMQAKRSIRQQDAMLYNGIRNSSIDKHTNRSIIEKTIAE